MQQIGKSRTWALSVLLLLRRVLKCSCFSIVLELDSEGANTII